MLRNRHGRSAVIVILGVLALLAATPARAATVAEVEAAIKKGREYLLSQQQPEGRWEFDARREGNAHDWQKMQGSAYGGYTAISLYALLASSPDLQTDLKDPKIVKAINFLKKADVVGTYALGLRAQVWLFLPESPERKKLAARDAQLLLRTLNTKGNSGAIGLWDYDDPTNNGVRIDHSVSQYGVLGLWACLQAGAGVEPGKWKTIEQAWRRNQFPNGGWAYDSDGKNLGKGPSISMTAAGVATLFITQDFIVKNAGIDCKESLISKHIDLGLKWMDENFGQAGVNTYTWYGIERIGAASGLKYFGEKDWYATGAEALVRAQGPDGSWNGGGFPGGTQLPATAYAVLFLSRGRTTVAINKLQYSTESEAARARVLPADGSEPAPTAGPGFGTVEDTGVAQGVWNQRPRDIANLVRWMGWKSESEFHWQIVNPRVSADDLHDAPILYIGGSSTIALTDSELKNLQQYLEGGGLILANANCGKAIFVKAIQKMAQKMYPKYEFRELPSNHLIYTKQQFPASAWKNRPKVWALTNGVRELIVLVPEDDAGRAWQLRSEKKSEELFQLGANIFSYALDKNSVRFKGQTYVVKEDPAVTPERTAKVVRLMTGVNPDPEPGGWRRLANILKNSGMLALTVDRGAALPEKLKDATVVHLTGTGKFELKPEERSALKAYVEQGGTLVLDAAGGAGPFADAAEDEIKAIFGEAAKEQLSDPLPAKHLVFNLPDNKIKNFGYRRYARELLIGDMKGPRLKGIKAGKGDRIGVFISREDLSAGMVGQPVDGILGYDPETATAIMRNIVIYAANGGQKEPPSKTDPIAGAPEGADPNAQPPAPPADEPLPF